MRRTRCGLGTLVAAVARSQIAIAEPSGRLSLFPDGFDEVDLAILVWIAGENRWFTRNALRNN